MVSSRVTGVPIHRLFDRQAELTPDAIALAGDEGELSYAQLAARADAIAAGLVERGIAPGAIVVTRLARSFNAVAAMLGILKAGAAYCPVDLNLPPARVELMIADAQPVVVLDDDVLATNQRGSHTGCISVDVGMDAPACVMYTSGSTGTPKGALIPHRAIHRLIMESSYVPFGPQLRTLFHSPPHFDASTFEVWASLLHGGTCVLFDGGPVPTLHELKAAIRNHRVNCAFFGPAPFNVFVDEDPDVFASLSHVLIGGEALSVSHVRRAVQQFPQIQFSNVYGPTETTTFATTWSIPRDVPVDARSIPIGKPIGRTECYLLDADGNLVPDSEIGELFIGGAGVALGYLNRAELTAQKFVPDRFIEEPDARLYRTGDLCRRLPDGNLEYVGRNDDQVKIHGQRIELGEIESILVQHLAVAQCVVLMHELAGDKHLAAYYTQRKGQTCTAEALQEYLGERLPVYMIPRWLVQLDQVPVNANGKVDRAALPKPADESDMSFVRPATTTQEQLLALFRQCLKTDRIGVHDSFFARGGTSLGAMRLCSLIERATDTFVPIEALAKHSTVAELEAFLQAAKKPAPHVGQKPPLFCAPGVTGHPITSFVERMNKHRLALAFRFPGFESNCPPPSTIEEVANLFIPQVQASARGPVHLMGFSFGGVVAWEMAGRLEQLGVPVRSLVLVDAYTPAAVRRKPPLSRLRIHAEHLVRHGPGLLRSTLRVKWNKLRGNCRKASGDPVYDRRAWQIWDANAQAFERYCPRAYSGRVIYLRCAEQPPSMKFRHDPERGGWDALVTGALQCRTIRGSHSSLFEGENLDGLLQTVNEWLDAND